MQPSKPCAWEDQNFTSSAILQKCLDRYVCVKIWPETIHTACEKKSTESWTIVLPNHFITGVTARIELATSSTLRMNHTTRPSDRPRDKNAGCYLHSLEMPSVAGYSFTFLLFIFRITETSPMKPLLASEKDLSYWVIHRSSFHAHAHFIT